MNLNYLDFEQPIAELESKIEELRMVTSEEGININEEIRRLKQKSHELTKKIFFAPDRLANGQTCPPPTAALYAGLHQHAVHGFLRAAW